jgi:acyl carrier protein
MNDRILRILSDTLGVAAQADTAMTNTPQWDSVAHLNVCLALEAEFGVTFSPEQMLAMNSAATIAATLAQ